jgi:protein-L-isoaspartate(D-aspartate) O-methyltransferase
MPPCEKGALVGRPIWTAACVIAFSLAAIWYGGEGCSQVAATSQPGAGATAPAGTGPTAIPPTTGPALRLTSAPATGTAPVKWAPPRFAARQRERDAMVAVIRDTYGLDDQGVLSAMSAVPRHLFVPDNLSSRAHDDTPLPIGYGQTISQPYIVALMTEWAMVKPGDKVLEVGTGSGYQAAVLSEITDNVFSVEIRADLAREAAERLQSLGYSRVRVMSGDGYLGWPGEGPFDAILVTAAAPKVPPALAEQLKEGGRLVIPLGDPGGAQTLVRLRRVQGELKEEDRLPVRFVPLVRPPVLEPGR